MKYFFLYTTILLFAFNLVQSQTTQIFDYTGADQFYTVPAGVNCIDVKMWGAGGGSGDNSNCGNGGGGAYVYGTLNVTPGQVLTIMVGGGGARGTSASNSLNGTSAYGFGGIGRRNSRGGGNGGGMSAIFLGATPLAIAGGGGGGGGSGSSGGTDGRYCGGAGGAVGVDGIRGGDRDGCTSGAGGCGGRANGTNNNSGNNCTSGTANASTHANGFQGGNGETLNSNHGGAGGGGGYGGGRGGLTGGNNSGGGGGGSSFFSGTLIATESGNTFNAGAAADPLNAGGFGRGGSRGASTAANTGNAGQNGRVVIMIPPTPTMGTFTLNGVESNITACVGQTINIGHTGWNNQGGTTAYWAGIENPVGSGWVTAWTLLENTCQNQNSCSFVVPALAPGTVIVAHSNAYVGCVWGAGVTRYITIIDNITPTFNAIGPFCSGSNVPSLPTTSNNNITGSWSPATINNTTSGTYTFTPNPGQCSAPINLDIVITPVDTPTFTLPSQICSGTTAPSLLTTSNNNFTGTWNPSTVSNTATNTYTFTPDAGQCATSFSATIEVVNSIVPTFNNLGPICNGASAPILNSTSTNNITGTWNPTTVSNTTTGVYTFTPDAGQCSNPTDFTIVVNDNIITDFTISNELCAGSPAPNLALTSNNGIVGTWNPTIISNTNSGTYTFTPNAGQCASTFIQNITVNSTYALTTSQTICGGQTINFGTQSLSAAGTYTETFQSVTGCDSIVTLNLAVNNNLSSTINQSICQGQSISYGGVTLSQAGTYSATLTSVGGCDSVVTLNLSVNPVYNTTSTQNICQGQTFNFGTQILSTSGTYTEVFQSVSGCDSTVSLTLSVNPNISNTVAQTICPGQTVSFGGQTLNNTGVYNATFISNGGCDSTVTLNLTVNNNLNSSVSQSICPGQTISFGGFTISQPGSYPVTIPSSGGCDSTITLIVTQTPNTTNTVSQTICQGQTINFGNQTISSSGTFVSTFNGVNGCDSIVTMNVSISPSYNSIINDVICVGQSVTFNGQTFTQSGNYPFNFQSSNGCDSTVTLSLVVEDPNVILTPNGDTEFCEGEFVILFPSLSAGYFYEWYKDGTLIPNQSNSSLVVSETGVYYTIVTSVNGCDGISNTVSVNVIQYLPTPTITQSNDTLYSSAPTGNQWYRNGNTLIGETNNFLKVTQNGAYTVQVNNGNCPSEMSERYDYSKVSVEEFKMNSKFVFYPNPNGGLFAVGFNLDIANQTTVINVFDINGRKVYEQKEILQYGENTLPINLGTIAPGLYFLAFQVNDYLVTEKILITR